MLENSQFPAFFITELRRYEILRDDSRKEKTRSDASFVMDSCASVFYIYHCGRGHWVGDFSFVTPTTVHGLFEVLAVYFILQMNFALTTRTWLSFPICVEIPDTKRKQVTVRYDWSEGCKDLKYTEIPCKRDDGRERSKVHCVPCMFEDVRGDSSTGDGLIWLWGTTYGIFEISGTMIQHYFTFAFDNLP